MHLQLGLSISIVPSNYYSLDAFFIIPAANGFPDLPAGKAQDNTIKLALDCEGLIFDKDNGYFISDEYGRNITHFSQNLISIAQIYQFSKDGVLQDVIVPPSSFIPIRNGVTSFASNNPPIFNPTLHPSPVNPERGRQNNQGFEGLTISDKGKQLYVMLQSALIQDLDSSKISSTRRNTRLLEWDLHKKEWTGEWIVQLPTFIDQGATRFAAQSEVHFLDDNRFLVLTRDSGRGFGMANKTSLYRHVNPFVEGRI